MRSWCTAAWLVLAGSLGPAGCGFLDTIPPPVPDGYPKIDGYDEGKAELVIDGEAYVTERNGSTSFNVEGGFEDQLRATMEFDLDFRLQLRDTEVREFTVEDGDLEVMRGSLTADAACGSGTVTIVGKKRWDSGIDGEREFWWGAMSLLLCETTYDGEPSPSHVPKSEITGRFSSIISAR